MVLFEEKNIQFLLVKNNKKKREKFKEGKLFIVKFSPGGIQAQSLKKLATELRNH
jgi:hypothetical protein